VSLDSGDVEGSRLGLGLGDGSAKESKSSVSEHFGDCKRLKCKYKVTIEATLRTRGDLGDGFSVIREVC
jgi:hypothetical protein